jgi:hypothetical protein
MAEMTTESAMRTCPACGAEWEKGDWAQSNEGQVYCSHTESKPEPVSDESDAESRMTRRELYAKQAREAAAIIATWPDSLRKSIVPDPQATSDRAANLDKIGIKVTRAARSRGI